MRSRCLLIKLMVIKLKGAQKNHKTHTPCPKHGTTLLFYLWSASEKWAHFYGYWILFFFLIATLTGTVCQQLFPCVLRGNKTFPWNWRTLCIWLGGNQWQILACYRYSISAVRWYEKYYLERWHCRAGWRDCCHTCIYIAWCVHLETFYTQKSYLSKSKAIIKKYTVMIYYYLINIINITLWISEFIFRNHIEHI